MSTKIDLTIDTGLDKFGGKLASMNQVLARIFKPACESAEQFRVLFRLISQPMEQLAPAFRRFGKTVAPGTEGGNLLAVLNTGRPDTERLEAAKRVARRAGPPIHSARWSKVMADLNRQANDHGRTWREELEDLTLDSIFLAIEAVGTYCPSEEREAYHALWNQLNNLLPEDLAGPGWRQKDKEIEWEEEELAAFQPLVLDLLLEREATKQRQERDEHLFQRLSLLSRRPVEEIRELINTQNICNISSLADTLGIERTKFYRQIVRPSRKESLDEN